MSTSWAGYCVRKGIRRCLLFGFGIVAAGLSLALASSSPGSAADAPAVEVRAQSTLAADLIDSLAIRSDGSLWIWGSYAEDEELDFALGYPSPVRVGTDEDWALVSDGLVDALALKTDGSLWDIGIRLEYEGDLVNVPTGFAVTQIRVGSDADWAQVSADGLMTNSMAVKKDGSLWALEYDVEAEEGDPAYDAIIPVRIGTDKDWAAVSTGDFLDSLALKTDGSLWMVSCEYEGLEDEDSYVIHYRVERVGTDQDWAAIDAGGAHRLALKTDGTLWAWGDNEFGQVGDGSDTARAYPVRVGTSSDWVAVSAGLTSSLGLRADGTLWAWGDNDFGQLGDGTTTTHLVPTRVGTSNKWRAVAAGYTHSLAARADGTLWAWGNNEVGQIGDGTTEERHAPTLVLSDVRVPAWPADSEDPVRFSDVEDSPYAAAIYDLAGRQVIAGFDDGTFRPAQTVTRQQFAKMIVKALGIVVTGAEVCPFVDVPEVTSDDPLYPTKYVAACAQRGITQGKTANTFAPYDTITREQLITMVARAAELSNPPAEYLPSFTSAQFSLEEHFLNARKAAYAGILDDVQGMGPSYDLRQPADRGECAQLLHNLLVKLDS